MELILAIVVASAVIFFGALISLGNERQRKAIDGLREQVALWAVQDLRIKREGLAREIKVENPLGWLNQIAEKIYGHKLNLQILEVIDTPNALVTLCENGLCKAIFTPISPTELGKMSRQRGSRLSKLVNPSSLPKLLHGLTAYEISILNSGILFDLELPLAWQELTGQPTNQMNRLWMYIILDGK